MNQINCSKDYLTHFNRQTGAINSKLQVMFIAQQK